MTTIHATNKQDEDLHVFHSALETGCCPSTAGSAWLRPLKFGSLGSDVTLCIKLAVILTGVEIARSGRRLEVLKHNSLAYLPMEYDIKWVL